MENAAVAHARGDIILHFDDDDIHPPNQVSALACPLIRKEADLIGGTHAYLALLNANASSVDFIAYRPIDKRTNSTKPFLGSLAYTRALAAQLSGGPFADVSLSEDVHFVERALRPPHCKRMAIVSGEELPLVYTRHMTSQGVSNTYTAKKLRKHIAAAAADEPPAFVTTLPLLRPRYLAAERDAMRIAAKHGACSAVNREQPADLPAQLSLPFKHKSCNAERSGDKSISSKGPYPKGMLDSLFRKPCLHSRALHSPWLIEAFRAPNRTSPETYMRTGGVKSTLMLMGIDRSSNLYTASTMSKSDASTAVGRAAWRRARRFAWYVWQAVHEMDRSIAPLLMLLDLDDLSDSGVYHRDQLHYRRSQRMEANVAVSFLYQSRSKALARQTWLIIYTRTQTAR